MKKQIHFKLASLALVLVLAACSSSPKEDTASGESNDTIDSDYSDLTTPTVSEVKEESIEKPTVETPHTENQALADAIKSNNDQAIYRASVAVLSKNPNDARALNALGLYHYRRGQYSAAQLMFGKALKVSPNSGELYNNMGLVFYAQKEQRDAIKAWRKAIELNNSEFNAAANVGSVYVEQKEYIKALVALEIAYRKNNKDQRVLNNYAIALTGLAKYSDAKDIYKQAIKLNENNKDVMLNYAILLIDHLKQNQEGLDLLNKVKFLGPSPEARNKINLLENKAKAGIK